VNQTVLCFIIGLWAVVNNAGIWSLSDIEMTSENVFRRVMDVNLFGGMRVTKAFLPLVRQAKGRVVFMSSITGMLYYVTCVMLTCDAVAQCQCYCKCAVSTITV